MTYILHYIIFNIFGLYFKIFYRKVGICIQDVIATSIHL
jgi:hypothetical protein